MSSIDIQIGNLANRAGLSAEDIATLLRQYDSIDLPDIDPVSDPDAFLAHTITLSEDQLSMLKPQEKKRSRMVLGKKTPAAADKRRIKIQVKARKDDRVDEEEVEEVIMPQAATEKAAEPEASPSPKPKEKTGSAPIASGYVDVPAEGRGRQKKKPTKHRAKTKEEIAAENEAAIIEKMHAKAQEEADREEKKRLKKIDIPETITVRDLAHRMAIKSSEVIKCMIGMGSMATINQVLDQDTAALVVEEMGYKYVLKFDDDVEHALQDAYKADLAGFEAQTRAPVVTFMGHVDHGKTTLLDHYRKSRVVDQESGGITQHIGAYCVKTDAGMVTFLDTPGHAAFTQMRIRGAKSTDIVVLVVAADDSVMPQTIEAIEHAKAAGVAIVVAVNKMDKEGADVDRVLADLAQHGVLTEKWGGEVIVQPVSGKTGEGMDALLDSILLQAEVMELKAVAEGRASGLVIESQLEKGRGVVATVLVQQGKLKVGDVLVVGSVFGRVRALYNDMGQKVSEAGPSVPAQVLGLPEVPEAGDEIMVVANEKEAKEVASFRVHRQKEAKMAKQGPAKLEDLFQKVQDHASGMQTLNIMVRADTHGSVEAIEQALAELSCEDVMVSVISGQVGSITESDVHLALASNAIIVGFNVRADAIARRLIDQEGVEIYYHSIIYDLIDRIKASVQGLSAPRFEEKIAGIAEVLDVFKSSTFGTVAGCLVVEGHLAKALHVRVLRDSVVIHEGTLDSLKHHKDDVATVKSGSECGVGVKDYKDIKKGDQIEAFERIEVKA